MMWQSAPHPHFFLAGALAGALAVTLPANAAPPQPAPEAPAREYARARFQAGIVAFDEERYKDAIDLFLEAHAIVPVAANCFNIGVTYEAMGDSSSALSWFRTYLRDSGAAVDAVDRADVEARIRTHEAKLQQRGVQQLTVLSEPEGATVTVEGRPMGVTPWTGELQPGVHGITLTLRGYVDGSAQVELTASRARDVRIELVREPARDVAPTSTAPGSVRDDVSPRQAGPEISPLTWTALGVGTAALGGALVFELLRSGAESDARAATQLDYADAVSTMETHRDVARVLAVTGGILAAAGATLLVIDLNRRPADEKDGVALRVTCGPGRCGITGRGVF